MPPINNNDTQAPRRQLAYIPLLNSLTSKYHEFIYLTKKKPPSMGQHQKTKTAAVMNYN
jgi:hypothetical protein